MDHCEEQEMEAEALAAIFDTAFRIVSPNRPFVWSVKLLPIDCGGDEEEEAKENHVAVKLVATIPLDYPDSLPELDVEILKGLAEEQQQEILDLATSEAEANAGMPGIYGVCEAVKEWLADNNVKGQDDRSMHAQMMRRAKESERNKAQAVKVFESQKKKEVLTEAEMEEEEVMKRRAEGTPCTVDNFLAWRQKFDDELAKIQEEKEAMEKESSKKKATDKKEEDTEKMSGFDHFSGNSGLMNLEAIEAAMDEAENDSDAEVEVNGLDEELFDDDEDLDDLDFDDESSDDDVDI